MNNDHKKWIYLIVLAIIWGSSFILIKKSLVGLTPVQLGALRTFIAGIFILLIGFRSLKKIQKHQRLGRQRKRRFILSWTVIPKVLIS